LIPVTLAQGNDDNNTLLIEFHIVTPYPLGKGQISNLETLSVIFFSAIFGIQIVL
jgi:hypothetical protein